ncbi:hypothetical protein KC953_03320 [Candidatus Saccharibacteria bacterium]|nr:hypothetical protein [Candidatus Saccharibacteria bacterium]
MEPFGIVLTAAIIIFIFICITSLLTIKIRRSTNSILIDAKLQEAYLSGYDLGHSVGRSQGFTDGYTKGKYDGSFEGTVERVVTELENIANGSY